MGKKQWGKSPPKGYEYIEPIMEALENELRDKVKESNVVSAPPAPEKNRTICYTRARRT